MTEAKRPLFIETTAGEIAAELARRGIAPGRRLTVAIEPDDWLTEVRSFTRTRAIKLGWSDEDIDCMIDEEREEVRQLFAAIDASTYATEEEIKAAGL
jgi:hypothetical protein